MSCAADSLRQSPTVQFSSGISLRRLSGFAFGVGTQAVFGVTVVGLYSFLRYGVVNSAQPWLLMDLLLALQFAVPHSILLHPATRRLLRSWISPEFYGVFFCLCTCASLLLLLACWRGSAAVLWELDENASQFAVRSIYRVLRHPVYVSFLGLIWFTPVMTLDHALLTVAWTAYIFVGSVLKDRRMLFFLGKSYRG